MLDTPNTVTDQLALRGLLDRYSDAVNQRDWPTWRDCWTPAAIWELGPPVNQRKVGQEAILEEVQRAVGAMDLFVQMNHAVHILSFDGDRASLRSTLNEIGRIKPENRDLLHGAKGMFILATYTDDVVRDALGTWRFERRRYQVLLFDDRAPHGLVQPVVRLAG